MNARVDGVGAEGFLVGAPLLEKLRKTFLLGIGREGYGFRLGRRFDRVGGGS